MLAAVIFGLAPLLVSALLAHALGTAAIALGLALAGRRPVDRLGAGLHRKGDDIIGGFRDAAAGEQRQHGGEQGKAAYGLHHFPLPASRAWTPRYGKSVKNPSIPSARY